MNTDKMFRVYIRQSDTPQALTPVCREVNIPEEIIPIINAHLFWLTRQWAWDGNEEKRQAVTSAVNALMEALAYGKCRAAAGQGGENGASSGVGVGVGVGVGCDDCDDCDEREENEMPCKDCIMDVRWGKNGKLEVLKYDLCKGCVWTTVSSASGTLPPGNIGDYLDDAGDWVDDIFDDIFDDGGNAGDDVDPDLIRCRKATTIVTALVSIGDSVIEEYQQRLPEPIPDWIAQGVLSIAKRLPPLVSPVITLLGLSHIAYGLTHEIYDDVQGWLSEVSNHQTLICSMVKVMSTADGLTGRDVTSAYAQIEKIGITGVAQFFKLVFREVDIRRLNDAIQIFNVDTSACGCPSINDPNSLSEPEEYDWCYTFDFTQDAFSTFWAVTTENGSEGAVWTEGVGYEDKIAAFQKTLSLHINNFTAQVVGADFVFKNEKRGMLKEPQGTTNSLQHYCGVGDTWNNATQFFYAGLSITDRAERRIQWRGFMNIQNKVLTLRSILAYDGVDFQNIPPDDAGNLVLRSIKMWGKGTNPFGEDNC